LASSVYPDVAVDGEVVGLVAEEGEDGIEDEEAEEPCDEGEEDGDVDDATVPLSPLKRPLVGSYTQ